MIRMRNSWSIPFVTVIVLGTLFVITTSLHVIPRALSRDFQVPERQPKTLNMTKGMGIFRDMLQNGMPFRPVPPPFTSLRNLFKVNGTQLTWVPLGSIIFGHNGKIIGG